MTKDSEIFVVLFHTRDEISVIDILYNLLDIVFNILPGLIKLI